MVKTLDTYGNGGGVREKQKQFTLTLNKVAINVLYISLGVKISVYIFVSGLLHRLGVRQNTITKESCTTI